MREDLDKMAQQNYKFEGWVAHSPDAAKGQMKYGEFEPKTWEESDVDIQISHSGICGVCSLLPTPKPAGFRY